jgi:hypothetical protein
MANASRRKGIAGEAEVAAIWRAYGFDVRGLEGEGDHAVSRPELYLAGVRQPDPEPDIPPRQIRQAVHIHSEVKRSEKCRPYEWMAQAEAEAPAGAVPVVAFRRNRSKWYAIVGLDDLARLLA